MGFVGNPTVVGIFLGFDFCPHSIIPITLNLEYPPWDFRLVGAEVQNNFNEISSAYKVENNIPNYPSEDDITKDKRNQFLYKNPG